MKELPRLTKRTPHARTDSQQIDRNKSSDRVYSVNSNAGEKYTAAYESIVPRDLWLALRPRLTAAWGRVRRDRPLLPFRDADVRFVGFAMVAKSRREYVYYHCSARAQCGEPYVRQRPGGTYAAMLRRISIDEEM